MWVFDGETWESDSKKESDSPKAKTPEFSGEFVPELQIVEIVPTTRLEIPLIVPVPFP